MTEHARDAEAIFLAALDKTTPQGRVAYVEATCAGDPELLRRVRELLSCHEASQGLLDVPPPGLGYTVDVSEVSEQPGTVIGPYKLLQQLGEGGMGTVYMAEQTQPVRRTVALKLIKAGMDSRQVLARFGAERQALALMDHPNIARVFDAGTTEAGRPYFVMELVKGISITKFCDERRLTLRERLELAIPVCQAVQHAHQKGIIHRDLKPSNVLIALYDGKPVPKIIDFGVAKATGPRLTDQTLYTEFGSVVGTLEYMSPEQAELNQLDIDTRSDIYSLGVLLYELLTGSTPLEHKRIKQAVFLELLRVIREEESPRPSMRLSTTEELPNIAACRHVEPRKLSGLVRGELDWIVMKALEKDRNRRYETANDLAADVRRYLDDEPVQACPPSARYRLGKFAKRHRVPLATAGAFAVVLVATSVMSVWQAVRGDRARAAAVLAYADAKANLGRARAAVDDYLTAVSESRLLESPLPGLQPLRKELLTTALNYYEDFVGRHQDDPGLRSDLAAAHLRVGEITDQIGSKDEALKAFQSASVIYEALARADPAPASRPYRAGQGRCLVRMAMIQAKQGRVDDSINKYERAIALLDQLDHDEPGDQKCLADLALADHYLAKALMQKGDLGGALRYQRIAIDLRDKLVDASPKKPSYCIDLAQSLNNLSVLLMRSGQSAQAFEPSRRANTILRTSFEVHPADAQLRQTLALSDGTLATLFADMGRWRESRPLYAESVEIMDRIVAENPAVTEFRRVLATCASSFGQHLIDHDEVDAGLNALAKARDQAETVQRTDPNDVNNLNNLASVLRGIGKAHLTRGQIAEALASIRQSIAIGERIAGGDNLFNYDLACGLAVYGEIAGRVKPAPGAASKESSREYADRAMAVLRQAVDRGYRQVDWIERDPELRSLHSRPDFQALLESLRGVAGPSPTSIKNASAASQPRPP